MNYIRLTGNNGSVVSSNFISFRLELEENGGAHFSIKKGREKEANTLASESKKVSPEKFSKLLNKADLIKTEPEDKVMVGGPEKIIGVKHGDRRITIRATEDNPDAEKFFLECLQLFDSGLKERLDEIIYF